MAVITYYMVRSIPQPSIKTSAQSSSPREPSFITFPASHVRPTILIPSHRHCSHPRLSPLCTGLPSHHHLIVLADYVPKFPRIVDTPVKDFIAPDVPLLPGFNADSMNNLFLPDLINPTNLYSLLLFISLAVAAVYLEIGALFNDFIQEKDFERLEDQFLQQQERRKNKNGGSRNNQSIESIDEEEAQKAVKVNELTPEERAAKERKRGLGWLAFITAIAIWCTGVLNKLNAFQP